MSDLVNVLSKEEFISRFQEDQDKRKVERSKKKVRTAMPFKEEIFIDVFRIIKEIYPGSVMNKDKELIVSTDIGKFHIKVVEKRVKVPFVEKEVKKEVFKSDVYNGILEYFQNTEKKKVFFSKEGVVIQRGEADYVIKIVKKKG